MFSHVFVGTDDLNKSRYFYDTVMPILGFGKCEYDAIKKGYYIYPLMVCLELLCLLMEKLPRLVMV